ncbi:cilia- and flagella-associated protein 70-like isoform X1 [Erpetoichthys calabaricus]|uniref:cilia- and flagella-associated protein 70-like isoform X1 n=1 Tax=Erpetoichthys calabaricus TaxID=27687 RepID=UPI00223417C1|nr:cilia- and flagella-associated protein 70-like isoform X1 [Erpetoichthys calabaricus]
MDTCLTEMQRAAIPVQVTVLRGRHLRGTKGTSLLSYARVEFNGTVIGDSPKVDSSPDAGAEYNFTCSFDCTDTSNTTDDLAHKPVILTLIEILPKEKKQKDEKMVTLGQAVVDLLPLLQGQVSFTTVVTIHPVPGTAADGIISEGDSKPQLEVSVSVPQALVPEALLANSNLLKVALHSLYSAPDAWSLTGTQFHYGASMLMPCSAERDQLLFFAGGVLKPGGEPEPVPRLKKWPTGSVLMPGSHFILESDTEAEAAEELGDLTSPEDRVFRAEAESTRKRVSWDTERRCFMDSGAVGRLLNQIVECRYWPLEIMRMPTPNAAKAGKAGKDKAEDEGQISFHGMVFVDMAALLYPGVKSIRGAYRIFPFNEADLYAKTKRRSSNLKDHQKQNWQTGRGREPSAAGTPTHKAKNLKEDKGIVKRGSIQSASHKPDGLQEADGSVPLNPEGQMYMDAKSYVVLEVTLDKALVPKRPAEELARRVKELIPARPPLPLRTAGAQKAVGDYHREIVRVADLVMKEYQELFGSAVARGDLALDPSAQEERKRKLLGELNYSGKYFTFKEQLKHSVVRVVREKLLQTSTFSDQAQLQAFLSQLYTFLVDQMHVSLNQTLQVNVPNGEARALKDCSQLRHFAREAEINADYDLASMYYQERIALDRSDPSHWFDYGSFCLLISDVTKAEECFQHALAIDQKHVPSLLLCGVMAEMAGRFEDAHTFFENATCVDATGTLAWTILGLFYEAQGNPIQAEMAFLEANKQLKGKSGDARAPSGRALPTEPEATEENPIIAETPVPNGLEVQAAPADMQDNEPHQKVDAVPTEDTQLSEDMNAVVAAGDQNCEGRGTTIFMEAAHFLLQVNALQFAQRALAQELLFPDGGPSCLYHVTLARLQLHIREFAKAKNSLQEALRASHENPDAWALNGHLQYLNGSFSDARQCYERTLDLVADTSELHAVSLHLGSIYLMEKQYHQAKQTYLRACKRSPTCLTWLGLGISCYRLQELSEAEDALSEANILNNRNPEVWGYLSLVCLQTNRRMEAEQAFKFAIKLNLQNEDLLREIRQLQRQVGFGNPAFE